jgi:hypothetical protein
MKRTKLFALMVLGVIGLASCGKDDPTPEPPVLEPGTIPAEITTSITLTSDRVWILKGASYVKSGGVLNIQAGTVIKSDVTLKGALVVDKGGKIEAIGTVENPIVFTSGRPANERAPGDWAGITIIGRATTNRTSTGNIEGGLTGTFGTETVDNDNSGTLKYVRIEYAGQSIAIGDEVNSLSLYAVGSGTTLDHIQVSYAKDDAFEFFGGTVNGKYLVSYGTSDDDFDFDFGYSGKLQFGVVLRLPDYVDANDAGNGIECNNESSIPAGGPSLPYTHPKMSNFTFVGTNGAAGEKEQHNLAARFRVATRFTLNNSILIGFKKGGFGIESGQTAQAYLDGNATFKNNLVHAVTAAYKIGDVSAQALLTPATTQAKAELEGCVTLQTAAAAQLANAFNLTAPDFKPQAGSPALTGTWIAPTADFFTVVNYRGAFGATDNWMASWTNFNPNAKVY